MALNTLSRSMTVAQFDNGYWYTTELKAFGRMIGIRFANRLRKDELEKAITLFLRTGTIGRATHGNRSARGPRDVDRRLSLTLQVTVYTNDAKTKCFLEREAAKFAPGFKRKSGARYRLNRWRERQIAAGKKLTYGMLVKQYVQLCQRKERFAPIPHGRYINFMSGFLAHERGASRKQAIRAWKRLKTLDAPKTYHAWATLSPQRSGELVQNAPPRTAPWRRTAAVAGPGLSAGPSLDRRAIDRPDGMTAALKMLDVRNRRLWRAWLARHHASSPNVWLVFHKAHTAVSSISFLAQTGVRIGPPPSA